MQSGLPGICEIYAQNPPTSVHVSTLSSCFAHFSCLVCIPQKVKSGLCHMHKLNGALAVFLWKLFSLYHQHNFG